MKHVVLLLALSLGVCLVYAKLTQAYFCSYDDFLEIHRAAFEDTRDPLRVFTTSHFKSFKYRPLNRLVTLITYRVSGGEPLIFRVRNVAFHVLNATLVYALGWVLFRSQRVSGIGAALFGLHPIANQATIGAVWPVTMAHTFFLVAILIFVMFLGRKPGLLSLAVGSLVSGWLSMLMNDTAITVFGLMGVYLVMHLSTHRGYPFSWRSLVVIAGVASVLLGSYFAVRALVVPRGLEQAVANTPSIGIVLKNVAMYLVALVTPVDSVLANEWFHTPLPPEIDQKMSTVLIVGYLIVVVLCALAVLLWLNRRGWPNIHWGNVAFLLSGILLPLLPVLAFSAHPSETYLYLSSAFYGLLLSYVLASLMKPALPSKCYAFYVPTVLSVLILFGAGTWVKNDRVIECATTARRILEALPAELHTGDWRVSFANVPGEPVTRRYGFYGFRGIDTIAHGGSTNLATSAALQLRYGNDLLKAEVVHANELLKKCESGARTNHLCVWVHWDGRVEVVDARAVARRGASSREYPAPKAPV